MINEAQQPTRSLLYQKEAAQAAFPALAAHFFPSQRCCHNQNTQCKDHKAKVLRQTTSQDKSATALSSLAILYSVYPEEAFQLPSSPRPKQGAGYLSE